MLVGVNVQDGQISGELRVIVCWRSRPTFLFFAVRCLSWIHSCILVLQVLIKGGLCRCADQFCKQILAAGPAKLAIG